MSDLSLNRVEFVETFGLVKLVQKYALGFLKMHPMTCNESDMEELFLRFFVESFDKLHTCFNSVNELNIVSFQVFVELETIIWSMFETTDEPLCSFDFFLILFHVRDVWIGLYNSAIAKLLVDIAIPLLEDMG